MSIQPTQDFTNPTQTAQVAQSAFPDGNLFLSMCDELGTIFADEQFRELYSQRGQPAESPRRLALVTLMQFAENLTNRLAADAVRNRIE